MTAGQDAATPPGSEKAVTDQSTNFYKHVVQSMDEGVVIVDLDENILFANPAAARIVGFSPDQLPGTNLSALIVPEELPHIIAETKKRLRGQTSRYTTRLRGRDGDIREVDVTSSPMRDVDGQVIGSAGVFLDVTEQRGAEQALERSEQDKVVILSSVSELVTYLDMDMRVIWANRAAGESLGQEPAKLVGRFCYEIWHGRDVQCDNCPSVQAVRSGRVTEGRVTTPDGRKWSLRGYPVRGDDGRVVGTVEVASDITEKVRAAEELQRHAERLEVLRRLDHKVLSARSLKGICLAGMECIRRLVSCLFVGVAEFDLTRGHGVVLATDLDESSGSELVLSVGASFPLEHVRHLELYKRGECVAVGNLAAVAEPSPVESKLLADGARSYLTVPLLADGQLIGVLCVGFADTDGVNDAVREIAAEVANPVAIAIDRERRERDRARLAAAVEQAGEAVAILGPSGQTEYVNPAAARIVGCSREELLVREHLRPDYSSVAVRCSREELLVREHQSLLADDQSYVLYQEMWQEVSRGRTWSGRVNLRRADGSAFPAEVTVSPLRDAGGKTVSYILVGRDASQEAALEEQLRHSQKMEAIGRLAGGVAHDFNNILTVVLGNAELLQQTHGSDAEVAGAVGEIHRAGQRAAELTRQLLVFARKGKFQVATVDLHETVRDVIGLLKPGSGRRIDVRLDLSAETPETVGDATQLQMALLNLGINACDAMESDGTVTFATRNVTVDAGHPAAHMLPVGDYVEVSVSDTGSGMDEATRARIFEPFFTTKEVGRGTGLGLPTVYGCVQYHGGAVMVDTAPGEGTTIRLLLPAGAAEKDAAVTARDEHVSGRILLVDDESDTRGFATRILTRAGYAVTDCGDLEEAWTLFDQDPSAYSLVILDLVMPHLSGRELFRRMKRRRDNVRVVLTTGGGREEMVNSILAEGAVGFVPKPLDAESLLGTVSRLLAAPPAGTKSA